MSFDIETAVPWGRSFAEYRTMFNLSDGDLEKRILGCSDGPAAFNGVMTRMGRSVVSCDPFYVFSRPQIERRIEEVRDEVMTQVRRNPENFIWDTIASPAELEEVRMSAMREFVADFDAGKAEGRYLASSLPELPFGDGAFDLALCSNFLFLYSATGEEFHLRAILEMLRVAAEVRVFPIVDINGRDVPFFPAIMAELEARGFPARLEPVGYRVLRNASTMLRISSRR